MDLKKIDPSLGLIKEFGKVSGSTASYIDKMRSEAIYKDGEVPARFKALSAMLWSVSARCEPCIRFYVAQAVDRGATEPELGEFLAIANTMGGCVGEMWALKAFKAYKEFTSREDSTCRTEELACCHT